METILEQWLATTPQPVNLDITRADGTVVYYSDSVYKELWRYWSFYFLAPRSRTTALWCLECWTDFVTVYGPDLIRAYDALYADYDPISNYDMTEVATDGRELDDKTDTVTPSGKTKVQSKTNGELINEQVTNVAGFNSTDPGVLSDVVTSTTKPGTGGYDITTTTSYEDSANTATVHSNDNSLTRTDMPASGYNEITDHKLHRYGNAGVTSSQSMIMQELEIRNHEILAEFVRRFISRNFSIMYGGV